MLHGLPVLAGKGFVFEGLNHTSYRVEYTENPDCMSHYVLSEVISLPEASRDLTLVQLLERARRDLDAHDATLEFSRDVVHKLSCPRCHNEEEVFAAVGAVPYARGKCPACGDVRSVITAHGYSGVESFGTRTLDRLGLPLFDVFVARSSQRELAYLLAGDAGAVLGDLASNTLRMASGAPR